MRKMFLGSLVCVAVALPGAAFAQSQATRSADDYVCQFSGECGDAEGEALEAKDAPPTKGFSLTRKAPVAAAKAAPAAKAMPAKRAAPAMASVQRPTVKAAKAASTSKVAKASKGAPIGTPRGDLSLSFKLGSAELTDEARANAKAFAEALKRPQLASKKVLIEGHTDRQGSREFNLDLSERRAQAVADYLKSLGVPADRLQVKGFGFDKPVSSSAERNRRVEAVLQS